MFTCTKCDKREFQLTQLSEMRLLAECPSCGASFIMDTIPEKKPRVEAADPTQHIVWDWKVEKWIPARRS
jgi:transcription elongation factor Elf1